MFTVYCKNFEKKSNSNISYIHNHTRNAWVLPRRCSVYMSHSRTNDVANYRNSYGKKTQVLETIKQTRSKHPKFLWEKQKRHNTCNSYGKNNKGTSKF